MHAQTSEPPHPPQRGDEQVADGYGVAIRVERGHLTVRDGVGPHRRKRRYARAAFPSGGC